MDSTAEVLDVPERLVISSSTGRVQLPPVSTRAVEGEYVSSGELLASVRRGDGWSVPVQTAFSGWVMGYLVMDGAPIAPGEPVAWLRVV